MYVWTCGRVYVCLYVRVYVCLYVRVDVCLYVGVYVWTCVLVVYVYMRDREMCLCFVSVVQETKPLGVIPLIRGEVREGMYVCGCTK